MSNHEKARVYIEKHKLLGLECNLELRLEDKDEVVLVKVRDTNNTGRLVIPSFITKIEGVKSDRMPLMFCKYREIYIDNKKGKKMSAKYLCAYMQSDRIKVVFRYPEYITSVYGMFEGCTRLVDVDISWLNGSKVTNMGNMFNKCMGLTDVNLSNLKLVLVKNMSGMFKQCYNLKSVDLSRLDIRNVEKVNNMFDECVNLKDIKLDGIKVGKLKKMDKMFRGCKAINSVDMSKLDTSSVEDMTEIFSGCNELRYVNIRGVDTHNVRSLKMAFYCCSELMDIDISSLDLSALEDMQYICSGCTNLKSIGKNVLDLSRVKDVSGAFNKYISLRGIGELNCRGLKSGMHMFNGCIQLRKISMDIGNISGKEYMFNGCMNLNNISIGIDVSKNINNYIGRYDIKNLLYGCDKVKELRINIMNRTKDINLEFIKILARHKKYLSKVIIYGISIDELSSISNEILGIDVVVGKV